jgi:hypothetical protein
MAAPSSILKVLGDVTFSSAEYLYNINGLLPRVNRDYDRRFGKTGAKIGEITNARLPGQFNGTTNLSSSQFEGQALTDKTVPVALTDNYKQHMFLDMVDLNLSVDDFMVRYGQPAMRRMSAEITQRGFTKLMQYTPNAVGTPGTAITSNAGFQGLIGSARQVLTENLAPMGEQWAMATPPSFENLGYTYTTNQFNPQVLISDIQKSGHISGFSGMDWFVTTQPLVTAASTYGGTPRVNGASQSGSSLITDGWTATTTTLAVGTVFTIAGVNAVNPETKQDLGYAKQFSVTAATVTDGAGNSTVAISPEVIAPGDPRSNISIAIPDNALITVLGATGTTGKTGLAFAKDAIIFATADISPSGAGQVGGGASNGGADFFVASLPELGLSVYCALQFDIDTRAYKLRYDVLGGWAPLYPQLSTKVYYG